jgi:2-amino-4-hydroxy-6-hydroxymethyldihydropteridine diphosphokinase
MNVAYLCLGGNIEKREKYLKSALQLIETKIGTVIKQSYVYETEAWGTENQSPYLNLCISVNTELSPEKLIQELLNIEKENGRVRDANNQFASRTVDIDILFYNDIVINQADLMIPHPRLHLRKFVLMPLKEICPNYVHPVLKTSIQNLEKLCEDQLKVNLFKEALV